MLRTFRMSFLACRSYMHRLLSSHGTLRRAGTYQRALRASHICVASDVHPDQVHGDAELR